jgi:hypothetical protein
MTIEVHDVLRLAPEKANQRDLLRLWWRARLPYCLHDIENDPNHLIILNRDYKPIGFGHRRTRVKYENCPEWWVPTASLTSLSLVQLETNGRRPSLPVKRFLANFARKRMAVARPGQENTTREALFFWNDSSQPFNHLRDYTLWRLYWDLLRGVLEDDHIERVVAIIKASAFPEGLMNFREEQRGKQLGSVKGK